MGKRKKDSNRQQSTSRAQDVVRLHNSPTSPAGKATQKTNTKTSICYGAAPTSLLSPKEMKQPSLTSTPQTLNNPLHTNSTELQDLLHTNENNVTATSTKNVTQRHQDSHGTSENRTSHGNIQVREIISQPREFIKTTILKSMKCEESTTNSDFLELQNTTMPPHYTLSTENKMRTRNEIGERKNSVPDLRKKPEVLLVSIPLSVNTQNSAQTAGSTKEQVNEKQHEARNAVTMTEIITEKMPATKVSQCGPKPETDNTTQNILNKQPTTAVNKESHISECVTACISTLLSREYEANTIRADTEETTQLLNHMKMDPPLTQKWSTLQTTGLSSSVIHKESTSPVLSTVKVPIKLELFQNERIHDGVAATTDEGGTSTNAPSTPVWSRCPTQKTRCLNQDADTSESCTKATDISATKAAVENGNPEYANISNNVSQSAKSSHFSSHIDAVEKLDKAVPLLSSTTKAVQGSASKEDADGDGKNARSKGTAKANDRTVDFQENKGTQTSHISICNQCSNNKEQCKVTTHENKTDTRNSHRKGNGVINLTNKKLKIIKADGETNKLLTSRKSYNKVCEKKTKSGVIYKDTKIDMNAETSEISNAQSTTHDFRTNEVNKNISISCNKNVKRHHNENTQNSITDFTLNAANKGINNQAQQERKKCMRNRRKNTAEERNVRDLRQEEYVATETCGCKEERTEFQMNPETIKEKGKQNIALMSEYSSETPLTEEESKRTKSGDSALANNKVSVTSSKEDLTYLTKRCLELGVSYDNCGQLPDILSSLLAPKPTCTVSTVDNEAEMEHILIQRNIFLTYVCHVCKSLASSSCCLKKCSNCKMISYCSKEHQKEHWGAHKDLCKVISKICKQNRMPNLFGKAVGISPDEYRYYRSHCINKCEKELGRELYLWEKEMICYPQVCHTCYESDTQKLTTCQKCHHVSYCKLSHLKTDHDIWCKEFQVYRDITLYQCHHGLIQPSLPDMLLQQYSPLTGDMKTFLSNINTVSEKSFLLHRLNLVALSDIATCPLTVLFSLQQCNFHLENIKTLTIHLVGAEMRFEVDTLQKWELFLLHLIPSLSTLKVVFIGPELDTESEFIQMFGKNETCSKCNTDGRMIIFEFWKTLYHKFVTSLDYKKPDLICAFNAGLYRLTDFDGKDTWSPTIKAMLEEPDIPVTVTEYTEKESPFDLQRIQNIVDSLEIITPPTRNPFASLKPSLNFLSEETVPVIFKNFYITVLKREKL
jgi:splicing suppressor protein 51